MRTVRMFGRTVTQYETPMVVRIAHDGGRTYEARVTGYTTEAAEGKALRAFRATHPHAVVDGIRTELR